MWCSNCRQDVPGASTAVAGQYACPRCAETMVLCADKPTVPTPELTETACADSQTEFRMASDYDDWEIEQRLHHLERIHARNPLRGPLVASSPTRLRIDSPHATGPREKKLPKSQSSRKPDGLLARFGQFGLGLGLAVTVCGACLALWAEYGNRPDLWPVGLPIAVVGQLLLLVGLVLQWDVSDHGPATEPDAPPTPQLLDGTIFRLDAGDGISQATPTLQDLSARLDDLSRRLDQGG